MDSAAAVDGGEREKEGGREGVEGEEGLQMEKGRRADGRAGRQAGTSLLPPLPPPHRGASGPAGRRAGGRENNEGREEAGARREGRLVHNSLVEPREAPTLAACRHPS